MATGRPDVGSDWGLGQAWLTLAIYLGAALVTGVVWAAATGFDGSISGPWLLTLVLVPQVAMLAFVVPTMQRKGRSLRRDLRLEFEWIDLAIGLAFAVAGLIAAGLLTWLITELFGEGPTAAVADLIDDTDSGLTIWLVLVAIFGATLVPLSEELVFRGLWWSALEKRGHSPTFALVVTSLVFAAFHLEPFRFPVLVALGVALGLGRTFTQRLGASIIAHAIINGLAFAALLAEVA